MLNRALTQCSALQQLPTIPAPQPTVNCGYFLAASLQIREPALQLSHFRRFPPQFILLISSSLRRCRVCIRMRWVNHKRLFIVYEQSHQQSDPFLLILNLLLQCRNFLCFSSRLIEGPVAISFSIRRPRRHRSCRSPAHRQQCNGIIGQHLLRFSYWLRYHRAARFRVTARARILVLCTHTRASAQKSEKEQAQEKDAEK